MADAWDSRHWWQRHWWQSNWDAAGARWQANSVAVAATTGADDGQQDDQPAAQAWPHLDIWTALPPGRSAHAVQVPPRSERPDWVAHCVVCQDAPADNCRECHRMYCGEHSTLCIRCTNIWCVDHFEGHWCRPTQLKDTRYREAIARRWLQRRVDPTAPPISATAPRQQ